MAETEHNLAMIDLEVLLKTGETLGVPIIP